MPERLSIHYIKSNNHQTIHVDGAHGGPTATGKYIGVSLYSERQPIPRLLVHEVDGDGHLVNPPMSTESREGLVREVHATLLLTPKVAKSVCSWLEKQLAALEEKTNDDGDEESSK